MIRYLSPPISTQQSRSSLFALRSFSRVRNFHSGFLFFFFWASHPFYELVLLVFWYSPILAFIQKDKSFLQNTQSRNGCGLIDERHFVHKPFFQKTSGGFDYRKAFYARLFHTFRPNKDWGWLWNIYSINLLGCIRQIMEIIDLWRKCTGAYCLLCKRCCVRVHWAKPKRKHTRDQ